MPKKSRTSNLKFVSEIPRVRTFRHTLPEWDILDEYVAQNKNLPIIVGEYETPEKAQHKAGTLRIGINNGRYEGKAVLKVICRKNVVYAEKGPA